MVDLRIKQLDHSRRLHRLRLLREYKQSEFDIRLCLHLWQRCHIMEVEASRVHNHVYHRGRVHSSIGGSIRGNKGSNLATTTDGRLFDQEMNHPNHSDLALGLTDHNTPHVEPNLPCKEEAHKGEVSSYSGALHRQES